MAVHNYAKLKKIKKAGKFDWFEFLNLKVKVVENLAVARGYTKLSLSSPIS